MTLNLAVIAREGAKRFGDKPALIEATPDGDRVLSYRELDDRARRLAGALLELGIARGQHVAIMMPNVASFAIAYYACHYAAVSAVPLNVMLKPPEIAYHLKDADVVELLVHHSLLGDARAGFEQVEGCRALIVSDVPDGVALDAGATAMDRLIATHEPIAELPDTEPGDTAVLLYTSGTTGHPKGAELTHFNLFYNADLASRLHRTHENSVALAVLPLFHSFGQTVILNGTLVRGGTVVLLPRFDAGAALAAIERHAVTFFAGVPTMYFALLHHPAAHPGVEPKRLASLEGCASGGAPMPVEVMRAFDARYGVSIQEGYGLSETSPVASLNALGEPKKPGSIGKPIWGIEFRLVAADGGIVEEAGVPGEIQIKGHNIMKGYYGKPEATRSAIRNGWFSSGDIATRDEDGHYFIVDRKKDMILRGGFNVYPREVEEVLYAHPAVAEVAVLGVPDERLGEEVKAVVALKHGVETTADELQAWCRERVAAYKYPRIVELVDSLPKGPTGKILKRVLRD